MVPSARSVAAVLLLLLLLLAVRLAADVAIALSPLLPPVPPPLDFWPFRAPFVPFRRFLPSSLDPLWSAPVLFVVAPSSS